MNFGRRAPNPGPGPRHAAEESAWGGDCGPRGDIFLFGHRCGLSRVGLIIVLLLAGVGALLIFAAVRPGDDAGNRAAELAPDPLQHPAYASYSFAADGATARIGYQPFWVCGANVAEAMKRDRILESSLRDLGLRGRFYPFLKGPDINAFVEQGSLDAGMCGDMPTLRIAATSRVLAPALVDQGYVEMVAVRPMLTSELRGKRIGYPAGSDGHRILLEVLDQEGTSERDVRLVPMDVTDMPRALASRCIDVCASWEPITSAILQQHPGSAVIHSGRYLSFFFFARRFAEKHPAAVRALLAAEVRALQWLSLGRSNVVRSSEWAVRSCAGLSAYGAEVGLGDFVSQSLKVSRASGLPLIPQADMRPNGHLYRVFRFLKEQGKLPEGTEWGEVRACYDRQIMSEILAHPATYRTDEFDYGSESQE